MGRNKIKEVAMAAQRKPLREDPDMRVTKQEKRTGWVFGVDDHGYSLLK